MKSFNLLVICLCVALTFSPPAIFANDLASYENTCKEIGFKPKTPDYGDCVLELRKRDLNKGEAKSRSSRPKVSNNKEKTNSTPYLPQNEVNQQYEAQANEFFRQQQDLYDMQLAKYQREEAEYLRQRSEYDAQIAKQEAAAEKRKNLKLIELGLRAMSGTSPNAITNFSNASADTMGIPRLPEPQRPTMQLQENYRITTPNGNLVNCRYDPNIRQATCY
jgi:hypothetical protein